MKAFNQLFLQFTVLVSALFSAESFVVPIKRDGNWCLRSSQMQSSTSSNVEDQTTLTLKQELLDLADRTKRGFEASSSDRKRANEIIDELEKLNPTLEPLTPYYDDNKEGGDGGGPTLAGKWTLVYTDAPDITGLQSTSPTAKLGRIGQECQPPFVKNVIEWKRPEWAASLPLSGSDESRILQKVCTEATASPDKPLQLDLQLAGLELSAGSKNNDEEWITSRGDLTTAIQEQGLPAALLGLNPINLQGPVKAPFGTCRVLYLDEDLRIIKTGQNFIAVNQRQEAGQEWF